MKVNEGYSPEELHEIVASRERRRTTLLSLVLVVLMLMATTVYLIVVSPAPSKDEEKGEPTEGDKEKTVETSFSSPTDTTVTTVSRVPLLTSESLLRMTKAMDHVALMNKAKLAIEERDERISELEHELDEVYSFIDQINEYLGGIYVTTD